MFVYALSITFIFIIFPALLVLAIKELSFFANEKLVNTFGFNSQIYVGGLGVVIHELSHLVLAIIFRHHINGVCLLRIPNSNDPTDKSLGYVNHSWNTKSIYQSIGNVFIGTAPVICGVLIIFLILSEFNPAFLLAHHQIANQIISNNGNLSLNTLKVIQSALIQVFQIRLQSLPIALLELILITSICFGGFDLSHADLQASKFAFIFLIILTFVSAFIIPILNLEETILPLLANLAVWLYLLFLVSILLLIMLNLIMTILKMIF